MAKALKIAAVGLAVVALAATGVGAVALPGLAGSLTAFGLSTSTLLLASAGLSLAAAVLTKTPSIPSSQTERLTASINPRAFRTEVLGQTAMATDVRYEEWSGANQDYCDWIIALASHAIDGVEEIWLDTEMAWSATTGVVGRYVGSFSVPNIVLEGSPANAFTFGSGKWNATTAHLTGCAYLRLRFKVTGSSKKAESPFSGGPTSRITIIGRGAKLYDPRRDSTVPGGSGPMRWNDQSTWRFTADDGAVIGENLPLLILRRLLGWRIRNPVTGDMKLATGSGIPAKRIDLLSFIIAANQADELVNRSAGGQEPRYYGAGVCSEGDDPKTVLDALCAACCGRFRDTGGKLSLVIPHNDLAEAATEDGLTADDVIGGFTWDPAPAMEAAPNVIRGRYVDASSASLYQMIDYPEVRLPSPDGIDRVFTLDLGFCESVSQAQRIAKQVLQRRQYERRFAAPFDIHAWRYPVGRALPFTFPKLGFNRTMFRVAEQDIGTGNTCDMVLEGEGNDIYAWDADDRAPVQAATAIVYDPTKAPLVQAVGAVDASVLQSAISTSFPIELTINAADSGAITISSHTRRYTDGHADVAVAGATIDSDAAAGDFRAIGYDDEARAGGAVTYQLFANDLDARVSPSHPGRHYVGYAFIPTAGSPPSSGGGATPPGGYCPMVDTPILMADRLEKPAGEIVVGDVVWTRHDRTLRWGAYPVEAVAIVDSDDVWEAMIGGQLLRATGAHLVYTGDWVEMQTIGTKLAGTHQVVKITVTDAHTYVSNGILSHNIKRDEPTEQP